MANRIKQFRYYADGFNEGVTPNEKNHPSQITKEDGKLTAVNAVDYQSGVVFGNFNTMSQPSSLVFKLCQELNSI